VTENARWNRLSPPWLQGASWRQRSGATLGLTRSRPCRWRDVWDQSGRV